MPLLGLNTSLLLTVSKYLLPVLLGGLGTLWVYWRMYRDSIRPEVTILRRENEAFFMDIEPLGPSVPVSELLSNRLQARLFRAAGKKQVERYRRLEAGEFTGAEAEAQKLQSTFLVLANPERQKGLLLTAEGMVASAVQPGPMLAGAGLKTHRETFHYFFRRDVWASKDDKHQGYRLVVVPDLWFRHLDEDPDFLQTVTPFVKHAADRLEHISALHKIVRGIDSTSAHKLKHSYKSLTLSLPGYDPDDPSNEAACR